MYKRKIMGILKYGTKIRTKTRLFKKEGLAVSKLTTGDDPMSLCYYNKRLHKLLQGFARQVEKRHLHLPE
jgi:hypothetical protein